MSNLLNISPVLPASDLKTEIAFLEQLGFSRVYDSLQYTDTLDYAVMNLEGQSIHLQLYDPEDPTLKGDPPQIKIWVRDLDILTKEFEAAGLPVKRRDRTPWDTDELGFYTPNHNAIIFVQDLNRSSQS